MHILDAFLSSIRKIAKFNPDVQVAPACILWPDSERQFENVIPQLQEAMPELLVLGDYAPDRRTGPAIWIRCALDGRVPNFNPCKKIPIVYMPGVSRASMRLVEAYPTGIKALAYYQYRGIFFSQVSAKDWTILAFLKSSDGGLGLDVATDEACKNAMQLSFPLLLNQEVGLLQGKHLDKDFFNTLISGGDPVKEILQWLNEGDSWRTRKSEIQWQAFVELCKSNYAFDPELDGRSKGLELFANRLGVWGPVFDRYAESYTTYRSIHKVLEEQPGPDFDLFGSAEEYGGWPQWNEREENNLLRDLESLTQLTVKEATVRLSELEQCHSIRRNLVWSRQGKAPLAAALAELMKLARLSQEGFFANSVQELGCYYEQQGYQVDLTAWKSIANLKNRKNRDTVKKVIRLFYQPWLEETSNRLQKLLKTEGYPASANHQTAEDRGVCYLFVDGLRLDLAREIANRLKQEGLAVNGMARWVPLPSMTANGKPAAVPAAAELTVQNGNADFDPLKARGITFAKYLEAQGIVLVPSDSKICWTEFGDIDQAGHDHGGDMPLHIESVLESLVENVLTALQSGFSKVKLVTDHGWLYLPGGLPKLALPAGLTDGKWGRYAALKEGAVSDEIQKPWFWNPNITVTLPPGICSHRANMEYAHGGLSLQECRLLELTITASGTGHVNDPERAKLSEIVERLNEIFGADTTEEDKLSWIKTKQRKLEESAILIEQAMSNTREQLASSKDLMHKLLRAVMKSDDAQSTLSRQVLSSPKKQEEILNLMFDIGGLYDRLREKGTNAVQ